ncbi:MAG: lytic transglycosylase domain-containing protein [Deltaproteobacteria bacterium]|nr:lytic transglycosylase domain-containing protein [Deltaproteobacteria bacterium]
MLALLFIAAASSLEAGPADVDPAARCKALGELSLLGDDEAYYNQAKRKAKQPCEIYHAAMSAIRLFDEKKDAGLLWRGRGLLAKLHQDLVPGSLDERALKDWIAFRRAEIAWRQRDRDAGAVLAGLTEEFPLRERAFLLGETLRGFKEPELAFSALQQRALPKGRLRLMQLQGLLAFGKSAGADNESVARWQRELWTDYPDAWHAPQKIEGPTFDELDARFSVLHGRHANFDVLKESNEILRGKADDAVRCRLLYYRGAALRKLRQYNVAERTLNEAKIACEGATAAPAVKDKVDDAKKKAWYLLTQVQAIARPFEIAAQTGTAFADVYPTDPLTDDVLTHLAAAASKAGEDDAAQRLLARVVKDHPSGDLCAEASFRMAYKAYRAGDHERAANQLAAMANGPCQSDMNAKVRALYWQSRALAHLKVPQATVDEPLLAIGSAAPLSYYGVLARHRLGRTTSASSQPVAPAPVSPKAELAFAERIRGLSRYGLFTEAQQELSELEAAAEDPVAMCSLYCEAFDYYRASKPFRKTLVELLGAEPSSATEPLWRIAYPLPFADVMQKAERTERLPKDLLVSLVREESAFRLDAGSWANAYGLTQLLVATAEATAQDMGYEGKVDADALRQPVVSLTLGAHHLSMLQKRFRTVPLILAGYNAGEKAVAHWLKLRGALPLDEFIEEIPLDETRAYVKHIMSTWTIYRHLGGRELPAFDLGAARPWGRVRVTAR